ncbi:MAG: DNA polymerase III subunit chi [Methylotenera sp.]|nr:DNA polymerase III subunit chi [Methylotenera sp.]
MTRVEFIFNVDDKLAKTTELCEKALAKSRELMVFTQGAAMNEAVQAALWQHSASSFLASSDQAASLIDHAPILVSHTHESLTKDDVLINLQDQYPPFFSRFRYLVELVGQDEADKAAARLKFRFYRDRGYGIKSTDMAA